VTSVEIAAIRTLFDDRFRIVEAELRYPLPNAGLSPVVRRLSFERGDSAAALVHDVERAIIVLARQFRFPTLQKGPGWPVEAVAGTIAAGETPEDCIRREIFEEVGYQVEDLEHISTFYSSPGGSSERIHLFLAQVGAGSKIAVGGGCPEEQEDIELVEIAVADIPNILACGKIEDAKTLVGLYWFLQRALRERG